MIFVFKTSVKNKIQVKKLKPYLNNILPVEKWHFDLEDCDKILRIDSEQYLASKIKALLNLHQFYCEELE